MADLVNSVMSDVLVGAVDEALGDIEYAARKFDIDQATGSGATDVEVRIEHLVGFYNELSNLHESLIVQITKMADQVLAFDNKNAGGHVEGITAAWKQMTAAAGARSSRASMLANMRNVDNEVLHLMAALQHNAQQYTANEEYAVQALGQASGTGGPAAAAHDTSARRPASAAPAAGAAAAASSSASQQSGNTSSNTGFGGK